MNARATSPRTPSGLTLLEVLIALFIFLVGVVGVMAVLPVGIASAELVIFQDAAIHLSASKFAEFRRDEIDPLNDLRDGSAYLAASHEPLTATGFRDFAHGPGGRYENFDDIVRYEWKIEEAQLAPVGLGVDDLGKPAPNEGGGTALAVARVTLVIHQKGSARYFRFTQYMLNHR